MMAIGAGPPVDDEKFVVVPGPEASVAEILEFAGTYDAYEFVADDPSQLEGLLRGVY